MAGGELAVPWGVAGGGGHRKRDNYPPQLSLLARVALAIPSGSGPSLAGSWLLPSIQGEAWRAFQDTGGSEALKKGMKN